MSAPQLLPCLAVILATAMAPFFSAAPSRQLRADGKNYTTAQIVATVNLLTHISPGPQGVPAALTDCPWSPLSCVPRWRLQTFQSFQVLLLLQPHRTGSQQETNGTYPHKVLPGNNLPAGQFIEVWTGRVQETNKRHEAAAGSCYCP